MKVFILIWNFSIGGAQKFVVKLANAHQRQGNPVTVLVADPSGPFKELFHEDVVIRPFKVPHTNSPFGLWSFYKRMKTIIEKDAMVVINGSNNFRQISRINFLAQRWNLIFRLHNDILIRKSVFSFLKRLEMKLLFNQKRVRILAMSEKQKEEHITLFKLKRVRHIPNFFPKVDVVPPVKNSNEIRAICMSRLTEEKGVQVLVPALAKVKKTLIVDIYGKGPLMEPILADIKRLGLNNINFKDPVLDVEGTMITYDFLILPSILETFGNSVVDALNVGLPVVTTDTDGPLNLVEEGINGFVAKKNDEDSLAMAIDMMIDRLQTTGFDQQQIKDTMPLTYREDEVMKLHMTLFHS